MMSTARGERENGRSTVKKRTVVGISVSVNITGNSTQNNQKLLFAMGVIIARARKPALSARPCSR